MSTSTGVARGIEPQPPQQPDLEIVKARQQAMWASGDYAQIGVRLQIVGESLCEAAGVSAGDKVLDVAAGNGNASLAAARRFADVTSTDYVPALLERGRMRAEADGLPIKFELADAESLPFADQSFDVVLSTFGVMFAPNQERAAGEMARVVKPGGRIGLANWTPEGFIGQFLRVVGSFVPPPPGVRPPALWGTDKRLRELFGDRVSHIRMERKDYAFRYSSPEHFVDIFRSFYGPTYKAFAALDAGRQAALHGALVELLRRENRSDNGKLLIPSEYVEVVMTR
ncbi:MAG: class I SAM-dependent methyltransferase [Vicinamibacterales bacterium]